MCKSTVNRYNIDISRGIAVLPSKANALSFLHLFTVMKTPQWRVLILNIEILQFLTANKADCKDKCESAGGKTIPHLFI